MNTSGILSLLAWVHFNLEQYRFKWRSQAEMSGEGEPLLQPATAEQAMDSDQAGMPQCAAAILCIL